MQVIVNGRERALPDGSTVDAVLGLLSGEQPSAGRDEFAAGEPRSVEGWGVEGRGVAVALDGEVVPRSAWGTTALRSGAVVEVLTAVQGG
jgi:sulfur carrier protein